MKRSIALLLAWSMLFCLAVPVFAAEGETPQQLPAEGEEISAVSEAEEDVTAAENTPDAQGEPAPAPDGGEMTIVVDDGAIAADGESAAEPEGEASPEPEQEPEPEDEASPEPEQEPEPEDEASPEPEQEPEPEDEASPEPEQEPEPEDETSPEPEQEQEQEPESGPAAVEEQEPFAEQPAPEPDEAEDIFTLLSDIPSAAGQVDISITKALALGGWTPSFSATLCGGGFSAELTIQADGKRCSFLDVPAGEHTLTISGQGIAAYTLPVQVGVSDGVLIELTVGRLAGYEVGAHPGVLQLGDVDGSGTVDSADAALMMQAVDQALPAEGGQSALGFTDLNGDGVTDLADAEYLAKGLDVGALSEDARAATQERYIPETAVAVGTTDDTYASGTENLFQDNGEAFILGRTDGEAIAPAAPVAMSFDMAEGAQTDVILLDDTNILSGLVTITYADGTTGAAMIGSVPEIEPEAAVIDAPEEAVVTAAEPETAPEPEAGFADASETDLVGEAEDAAGEPVAQEEPDAGETVAVSDASEQIDAPQVPLAELPGLGSITVVQDGSGNIALDLGGRKAVKRVTLKITETTDHSSLAFITQVEFVNGMEDRIPEPSLDIPQGVSALGASRQFTVAWTPCVNITGYEVEITADGVTEIVSLAGTSLTVTRFNKDDVRNYTAYQIRVQSVNGSWTSGWSEAVSVTPTPSGAPDKPDNVKAEGGYQSVTVSWKAMKDTVSYDLYYKEASAGDFDCIPDITASSYTITGLDSSKPTTYEVYVVGKNELGSSPESMHASAVTISADPAEMPRYKLINRDAAGAPGANHIVSAVQNYGVMADSPLDTDSGTAWGTVDGNGVSSYQRQTWDDGGYNNLSASIGLIYTFDQPYQMDTIGMMSVESGMDYTYVKLRWWDSAGEEHYINRTAMSSERRIDSAGRTYFFLRLPEPVEAVKVQIGVARYWAGNNRIAVSEVYFYEYDSLKRDIMGLYADDLHTALRDDVTREDLDALRARIDETDEFGNPHPDKAWLLTEWETAEKIFQDQFLGRTVRIHTGITASGDEHGFGGLNAWQPLGVTAAAGQTVTVYVGNSALKTGSNTDLELVITQYHAESSAMSKVLTRLKAGANEVKIPKIWTNTGMESGGALYVQYTGGASGADNYAVRVSGGTEVPVLDLYHVTDPGERASRTAAYVAELSAYAADIPALHGQLHQGEGSVSSEVDYAYNEQNCILGATDILLDSMLLSLPAQQVVSGCNGSADTLLGSLDAMEDMMALFYQHKGLSAAAPNAVDRIPYRHLNIRYQRMFSGAFMYAAGNHIGIGWSETDDMAGCAGVQADANGLYLGGNYFGWGVAHEIGHNINQNCYAIAEITNNYFSVLAQARDTNDSVRFDYTNVYAKVTSGAKGSSSNVFTQLGMYWQLHLAYDNGYNFKTYSDYDEQLENLFFARVDTYARTPDRAPAPGGVALTLTGADVDQTLMRLTCAAAERDLLDFFQRWGKTPDETTVSYAAQFPKETRAIYYVCDDSRRYTMESGGVSKLRADGTTAAIGAVTAKADTDQANKVNISIAPSGALNDQEILGYEIVRCTVAGGRVEKRPVGFATARTFADVVYALNNRTVYYEITLVDKYLNRSAPMTTEAVKIQHEGDLDKTSWTVVTTGLTPDPGDIGVTGGDQDMPEVVAEDVAMRMADGRVETVYNAAVGEDACIELRFNDTQVITGFRYTAGNGTAIDGYTADVLQNGQWQRVGEGQLNGSKTMYFSNADGKYVSTYAADALRLTLTGQTGVMISVAELDALGLTGDNVDFGRVDDSAAIGYLEKDFRYGDGADDVIPGGSLVFTGSYKGNAAYNVVMLYDQDGNVVAGNGADGSKMAYQTILSHVPETGNIQDVNDGIWLYWIQPEDMQNGFKLPGKVRVELYRVNNAQTNEGERLVSDSLFADVPTAPGYITIGAGG